MVMCFFSAQCIFFPGNFRWKGGDRFHITQERVLHLHELAKVCIQSGNTVVKWMEMDMFMCERNYN